MTDENDLDARRRAVEEARVSFRLEGIVLSPEIEELNELFIAGEISLDEHLKRTFEATEARRARQGKAPDETPS